MSNMKISRPRSQNVLRSDTTKRMENEGGTKRIYGRYVKSQIGGGRYEPVEAFTLREKVGGKFKVVGSGFNEEYAKEWLNS